MAKSPLFLSIALISLAFSNSVLAAGSLDILCKQSQGCEVQVISALSRMGCAPLVSTLNCEISITPNSDATRKLCRVETANCTEPKPDLIFTTHCESGEGVHFKAFDRNLSLSWWMGFGGSYISYICRDCGVDPIEPD